MQTQNPLPSTPSASPQAALRGDSWLKLLVIAGAFVSTVQAGPNDSIWEPIFNHKDIADWTPYFQKTGLKNTDSTFKVTAEGNLFVDIHLTFAQTGYGHLFYTKKKLSYYMVRATYKFTSDGYGTSDWAQGWNRQNNGLMLHSQEPSTMNGKDFPTSIEVQLLGPKNEQNPEMKTQGFKYATTANLCTPSTFVAYKGNNNYTQHCTAASYPAAWKNTEIPWEDKDGWSDVTVRVLGGDTVQHFIHGEKVMEYSNIRLDNGTALKEGYLAIQVEGTSTLFKSIEVLSLVGCTDKNNPNYKAYYVKNDAADCDKVSGIDAGKAEASKRARLSRLGLPEAALIASPALKQALIRRGMNATGTAQAAEALHGLPDAIGRR